MIICSVSVLLYVVIIWSIRNVLFMSMLMSTIEGSKIITHYFKTILININTHEGPHGKNAWQPNEPCMTGPFGSICIGYTPAGK